ncbi:baseplate J/gp47 family protein [Scatolibacter rhodanostii]|uniref:baseplate J/gp47 family protein n=1 Tax=Scatolibacter rhodanostii TaxID=2014781 RepID=UPI000C08396E|nr:baseplate J/gp47 family protein [Scatolibacter rhodanostii]
MTYHEILQRMQEKYEEESGSKADEAADIGIRLKVLAGEIHKLSNEIFWLRRQAFPQTALGRELDYHAKQRGLARYTAKKAMGVLTFSRTTTLAYDVMIPLGTICATSGDLSQEYETVEAVVLKAGQLSILAKAQAVQGGKLGNAAIGSINTLVTPPVGIEKVSNAQIFSGGEEEESDEMLRVRLMQAYSVLSNGTNGEFYRRSALEVEGVYSAMAVPREKGIGTVTVYVWGNGAAPPESVLEAVRTKLNAEREINVDVAVSAAKEKLLSVYGYIIPKEGVSFEEAADLVAKAVRQYYAAKKIGDSVYKVDLGAAFMNTGVVKNYSLALNVLDYGGEKGVIPLLSEVKILEMKT